MARTNKTFDKKKILAERTEHKMPIASVDVVALLTLSVVVVRRKRKTCVTCILGMKLLLKVETSAEFYISTVTRLLKKPRSVPTFPEWLFYTRQSLRLILCEYLTALSYNSTWGDPRGNFFMITCQDMT